MANWGAMGQLIGQGFNQGFMQGVEEELYNRRAIEQQKQKDKYLGQQVAGMLLDREKQTEEYAKQKSIYDDLLKKQNTLEQEYDAMPTASSFQKNFTGPRPQDYNKEADLQNLKNIVADKEKEMENNQSAIALMEDYINNPLKDKNRSLYDMAIGGNTYATQQIKDILYPKAPDWQIRTTKSFDPATNLYKETDTAYYIDDKGNIVKGSSNTRTTGKDWTAYELANRNAGGGSGSGSGNDKARYYTPEQLDELYLLNQDIVKMYPQIKTLIGNLNKSGYSALIPDVFSSLNTGYQEMPEYNHGSWLPWDDNNQAEIDRIQAENKNYLATRQEVLNLTGYDIADKNTQALLNQTKQNQLSELKNKGVKITDNKNGTYTLKYGDVVDTISELDLLEKGML